MTRLATRTWQLLLDFGALTLAYIVAFLLRFDWFIPPWARDRLIDTLPYAVLIQYGAMALFGTHRYQWRYVGLREVTRIFGAISAGTGVLLVIRTLSGPLRSVSRDADRGVIPYGIILAYFLLSAWPSWGCA